MTAARPFAADSMISLKRFPSVPTLHNPLAGGGAVTKFFGGPNEHQRSARRPSGLSHSGLHLLLSVRTRVPIMHGILHGKNILIVEGSLIAPAELQEALYQEGARPFLAHNLSAAFELVKRVRLDAAIVDQGLHNEAFDLCAEFQAADIPYISCAAPHRLQGWAARKRDAEHAIWKLGHVLSRVDAVAADLIPAEGQRQELHSH